MTQPTTSIRLVVARHVAEVLAGHELLGGVTVDLGWPGDKAALPADHIWLNEITTGDLTIPVGTGGRKHRDDIFTIRWIVAVRQRGDLTAAWDRLIEIDSAIEDILAEDPTLGDLPGVVSAELTDRGQQVGTTPAGPVGHGFFAIAVHSRLT